MSEFNLLWPFGAACHLYQSMLSCLKDEAKRRLIKSSYNGCHKRGEHQEGMARFLDFFGGLFICVIYLLFIAQPLSAILPECSLTVEAGGNIQAVLDEAPSGAVVCIKPGTYTQFLSIPSNVTVQGTELSQTIIKGETGTLISLGSGVILANIIVEGGDTGILAQSRTDVTVRNVVVRQSGIGLYSNNSQVNIQHCIFDRNEIYGLQFLTSSRITIIGNMFIENGTDISSNAFISYGYNLIHLNTASLYPEDDETSTYGLSPEFVDHENSDYHLSQTSPAIDQVLYINSENVDSLTDIGVYGGEFAEESLSAIAAPAVSLTDGLWTVSWPANGDYRLVGYKLYFDADAPGQPYEGQAAEGSSPLDVGQNQEQDLSAIVAPQTDVGKPSKVETFPADRSIEVRWSAVAQATGYRLYYGLGSTESQLTAIDVGQTTKYVVEALDNDTTYFFAVSAYYKAKYYFSVSGYDAQGNSSSLLNETVFESPEAQEGAKSDYVSDFAEKTIPYPALADEGRCFVATVVYGSSNHRAVLDLRLFRDQYLLKRQWGKRFVNGYYLFGPTWANYIQEKPWLKKGAYGILQAVVWPASKLSGQWDFLIVIYFFYSIIIFFSLLLFLYYLYILFSFSLSKVFFILRYKVFFLPRALRSRRIFRVQLVFLLFTIGGLMPKQALAIYQEYPEWYIHSWTGVAKVNFSVAGRGKDYGPTLGVGFGWQFFDNLELMAGVDFSQIEVKGQTQSGRNSQELVNNRFADSQLSLIYRLQINPEQVFIPYGGLGANYSLYQQRVNNDNVSGDQYGYHLRLGGQFLLDILDPASARRLHRNSGILHSYLFTELNIRRVDNFSSSPVDIGQMGMRVGLMLGF